jgi:hypothetical protein
MSLAAFQQFEQAVFRDPALVKELSGASSLPELMAKVIATGRERGFELTEEDLGVVVNANRRAWLERWVEQ